MKIGFVPYQEMVRDEVASTRIRVTWPAKYDKDIIISSDYDTLIKCDVVVFQTRIEIRDIALAERLNANNVAVIFDFTDPHWLKDYDMQAIHPVFKDVTRLAKLVTLSTEELERTFKEAFPGVETAVVPDRIDLSVYDKFKEHEEHSDLKILWHGSYGNIPAIDLARDDLERLGEEFDLTLVCVYDRVKEFKVRPFKNIKLESREWSTQEVIDSLLKSDVSINPKYNNHWKSYKSNNKTVTAWALGIPCVESSFYDGLRPFLSSVALRMREGAVRRLEVIDNHDVAETPRQWKSITAKFDKGKKEKKHIAVYTSICGGRDGLREDIVKYDSADYFAFTDGPRNSDVWEYKDYVPTFLDACRQAKIFKVLPWQFLDYEYSIWIDGTIALTSDPKVLIDKYLNVCDIAIFKHRERDDIFEEYPVDISAHKEDMRLKNRIISKYNDVVPKHSGMWEPGIILRRHTEPVKRLCETWWAEISAFTTSDLLPLVYAWRTHDVKIMPIPGTVYNNDFSNYVIHGPEQKARAKGV